MTRMEMSETGFISNCKSIYCHLSNAISNIWITADYRRLKDGCTKLFLYHLLLFIFLTSCSILRAKLKIEFTAISWEVFGFSPKWLTVLFFLNAQEAATLIKFSHAVTIFFYPELPAQPTNNFILFIHIIYLLSCYLFK